MIGALLTLGKLVLRTGLAKKVLVAAGVYQGVKAVLGEQAANKMVELAAKPTPAFIRRAIGIVFKAVDPIAGSSYKLFEKLGSDIEYAVKHPPKRGVEVDFGQLFKG